MTRYMRELTMPRNSNSPSDWSQRQSALSRWDNEGGAGPDGLATGSRPTGSTLQFRILPMPNS